MGAADEQVLFAGGRLILTPSDLVTDPNYGGTNLGTVQSVALVPTFRTAPILAEEYGNEVADEIYLGEEWVMTCILRNYDPDCVAALFPNTSAGTVAHPGGAGNIPVVTYPGSTIAPGELFSGNAQLLLYVPDDSANMPAFIMRNAVPRPDPEEIQFSNYDDLSLRITWLGLRDASSRVVAIGPIADLSL